MARRLFPLERSKLSTKLTKTLAHFETATRSKLKCRVRNGRLSSVSWSSTGCVATLRSLVMVIYYAYSGRMRIYGYHISIIRNVESYSSRHVTISHVSTIKFAIQVLPLKSQRQFQSLRLVPTFVRVSTLRSL